MSQPVPNKINSKPTTRVMKSSLPTVGKEIAVGKSRRMFLWLCNRRAIGAARGEKTS
jgi:hypothetical protein